MQITGHVVNLNWYIFLQSYFRRHLSENTTLILTPKDHGKKTISYSKRIKSPKSHAEKIYKNIAHFWTPRFTDKKATIQLFTEINYFIQLQSRRCIDV